MWESTAPGCFAYCETTLADFDPTDISQSCNQTGGRGLSFVNDLDACADCVRNLTGLGTSFDKVDAQDLLDMVNTCQSNSPTDTDEMVSAMSVISSVAALTGTIAPYHYTGSPLVSSTAPATNNNSDHSENKVWIAGAVVGPVVGVTLVVGFVFFFLRRRRRHRDAEGVDAKSTGDGSGDVGYTYQKAELAADDTERYELVAHDAMELPAKPAPQELNVIENQISELPADEIPRELGNDRK